MFKKLVNEIILTFDLRVKTPLLINRGIGDKIKPGYDMSPVVTQRDGKETVYIPGSSIKGVFRTRCEQLLTALSIDRKPCNVVNQNDRCKHDVGNASQKYRNICPACRLFGNLSLGSRIRFTDAYPVGECKLGFRHGVGIDRITGAAYKGAKFDYQMVELATFRFKITLQNFALYQLRLILAVIQDISEGLVRFGMGGTRGNGWLELDEKSMHLRYHCTGESVNHLRGFFESDEGGNIQTEGSSLIGSMWECGNLDEILNIISINDRAELETAINAENKALELEARNCA